MNTRQSRSLLATFTALVAIGAQSVQAQEYEVTDLRALGQNNTTWSINAVGQIAGYSRLGPNNQGNYHTEGFFYDGTDIHYIGTPGGAWGSDLLGVNDLGEAVGKTWADDGRAVLRRANGSVRRLGTLGGSTSYAMSINNLSQVVGKSDLPGDAESRAFVWEDGVMQALPVLGGTQARAAWINDAGQIVGSSTTDTDGLQQFGVLWDDGVVTRLPPIYPEKSNIAYYIHNDGSIAGRISFPGSGGFVDRAAIWRDGEVDLVLGTLADGSPEAPYGSSIATGVNASGVVVGESTNAQGHVVPFVYRDGEMIQLDELMPEPWVAIHIGSGAINDAGQIAVTAVGTDQFSYALLLTPVYPTEVADDLDTRSGNDDPGYYLATRGRRITYGIPRSDLVTVSLFDVTGRPVAKLINGARSAGEYEIVWNGQTTTGRRAASGVYFVQLATSVSAASSRLVLLR
jgi:probable HAF family extracellular repeat protein